MSSNPAGAVEVPLPPQQNYDQELDGPVMDPVLAEQVREYESRTPHEVSSSETLEDVSRRKELNTEQRKEHRWQEQDELKREKERIGRVLHHGQLLEMLRKILPGAWYSGPPRGGMIGLNIREQYFCAVQHGWMPEYSVMCFDAHDVPLAEKYRGWRTVLLRLILEGKITEQKAHEVFGEALGTASRRYRHQLWGYRNRGRRA